MHNSLVNNVIDLNLRIFIFFASSDALNAMGLHWLKSKTCSEQEYESNYLCT